MEPGVASHEALRGALRAVVAEIMGTAEPVQLLNALFGLELPEDVVLSAPTARALAHSVERAWFDGGATEDELAERLTALADDH
ncbi:MAG: hypothetical protein ACRDLA_08840 [Thermoleophilaceae bacterium]